MGVPSFTDPSSTEPQKAKKESAMSVYHFTVKARNVGLASRDAVAALLEG